MHDLRRGLSIKGDSWHNCTEACNRTELKVTFWVRLVARSPAAVSSSSTSTFPVNRPRKPESTCPGSPRRMSVDVCVCALHNRRRLTSQTTSGPLLPLGTRLNTKYCHASLPCTAAEEHEEEQSHKMCPRRRENDEIKHINMRSYLSDMVPHCKPQC